VTAGAIGSAGERYDEVPYPGQAIAHTSPDAMATKGTLFGMSPAPAETCRVLELGCAAGSNLVAMAVPLPDARFIGIDASQRQIEMGRALVRELGIGNVELTAGDILDLSADLGEFDYIVCHGVYSWVPAAVQERILEIFARHLAPQGIAYLSYNTYPGCHLRAMAREMMQFHVRAIPDPAERTEQARALIELLKRFAHGRSGPYEKILEDLSEHMGQVPDYYVFHEYLEEHNAPVYFSELVATAAAHGLQYLAPANFITWEHNLPSELDGVFQQFSDRIVREQYLDFLSNRMFRRTLFCRAGVPIAQAPRLDAVERLLAIGRARPVRPDPDVLSNGEEEFRSPSDDRLSTNRPLAKATFTVLAELMPRPISIGSLWRIVSERLNGGTDAAAGPAELARILLRGHLANLVKLRVSAPPLVFSPGSFPVASPLARLQAARNERVVNLRHEKNDLDDLDRFVLPLLDGTRDQAAITEAVVTEVARGGLGIEDAAGARLEDPQKVRDVAADAVNHSLERLAAACLLTA
jgi:methyltransferase-like protein/SAM-dependent methyltransferase